MFSDPQTVTVNSVAKVMPRVETGARKSIYQLNDQTFTLTLSTQQGKDGRLRHMARIDQRAIVTNPLDSTSNDYDTQSVYIVYDRPSYGFTMTQMEQLAAGLFAHQTAGNIDKLWGGES